MKNIEYKDIVVSYWSGNLPEVSYLHFLSFRILNPETLYILYLESDLGLEGYVSDHMAKELGKLNIKVNQVRLKSLMKELGIPKFSPWRNIKTFRVLRELMRKFVPVLWKLGIRKGLFNSDIMGITWSHNFLFSGFSENLPSRADLFRSLIHAKHTEHNFLYVDLDICFIKKINFNDTSNGVIAQWGTGNFGNSAYLMLPASAKKARAEILAFLRVGVSAHPWILYNNERLTTYGLNILDSSFIDPAWSPKSVIYQDSSKFFCTGHHVEDFLVEVTEKCTAVHWHNQWNKIPEVGSPFERLLRGFEDDLAKLSF